MNVCWRLVTRRIASVGELKTCWTRQDVLDANDWLDALDEASEPKK